MKAFLDIDILKTERLEMGGPCWLLKLRYLHIKGALSWLVHWSLHAGTRDFSPVLIALVGPSPRRTLFQFVPGRLSFSMCLWS
jgi:hypothetical protein